MNLSLGFFRLWIVLSTIFAIAVAVIFFGDAKKEFESAAVHEFLLPAVPIDCSEARGKKDDDYVESVFLGQKRIFCWYEAQKFRVLYPDYKDLNDDQLSDRLYSRAGLPIGEPPAPWTFVLKLVARFNQIERI